MKIKVKCPQCGKVFDTDSGNSSITCVCGAGINGVSFFRVDEDTSDESECFNENPLLRSSTATGPNGLSWSSIGFGPSLSPFHPLSKERDQFIRTLLDHLPEELVAKIFSFLYPHEWPGLVGHFSEEYLRSWCDRLLESILCVRRGDPLIRMHQSCKALKNYRYRVESTPSIFIIEA